MLGYLISVASPVLLAVLVDHQFKLSFEDTAILLHDLRAQFLEHIVDLLVSDCRHLRLLLLRSWSDGRLVAHTPHSVRSRESRLL